MCMKLLSVVNIYCVKDFVTKGLNWKAVQMFGHSRLGLYGINITIKFMYMTQELNWEAVPNV